MSFFCRDFVTMANIWAIEFKESVLVNSYEERQKN